MRLLVSNDDGYLAPGLQSLAGALTPLGEVIVVAPDRDRSGASNSLTLRTPIRPRTAQNGFIYVDGTPTDCVHLAVTGLLDPEPDIVVSGINAGANLGDDVIYSGTVAAAMEGRVLGLPAIAVSLASSRCEHLDTAAQVARRLVERIAGCPLDSNVILNVNVPDVEAGTLRGFRATRLGHRHRSEPVIRMTDPRGGTIYWVGPTGAGAGRGPGDGFRCGARRLRIRHSAACRPHAAPEPRPGRALARRGRAAMIGRFEGFGMTSPRTRERLVTRLRDEGITDENVLDAIRSVPRHIFVDEALASRAYEDIALPIGMGQTISQPFIVALMTQATVAEPTPSSVLEIGTGCGYQTAVLASLVARVYTVERIELLLGRARRRLRALEMRNVWFKHGDGNAGWAECAPFDAVLVTAAPPRLPEQLVEQLAVGGRLVIPIGDSRRQRLKVFTRTESGVSEDKIADVSFVPMLRGKE